MPLATAHSDYNNRPNDALSMNSTHHFVSDPFFHLPLQSSRQSIEQPLCPIPMKSEFKAVLDLGADHMTPSRSKSPSNGVTSLVSPVNREVAGTRRGSGEPSRGELPTALDSIDRDETISITSEEHPTMLNSADRDENSSATSDDSDGNVSIPHGELYDETESVAVPPDDKEDGDVPSPASMPLEAKAQLEAWYAVHGRVMPPCATSSPAAYLGSRNVSGERAYFIHKSGERLKVRMYSLSDVQLPKNAKAKQNVIVAEGPTQGPSLIKFASQRSTREFGTSYKIWHGVRGGDKDGFERIPSVYKRYNSTGTKAAKQTHDGKRVALTKKTKLGFRGNQFYAADGTPKVGAQSQSRSVAASPDIQNFNYNFRPSKRQKQDDEGPASYNKLLAAFSSSAEPTSNQMQGVVGHMQNNAVFLFYSQKSPQPRARLFRACNTMQKLFAQALAGDVFDQDTSAAKVLSMRVAGQQKAMAVVEDDEQDFEEVVDALKAASCWVSRKDGEVSGSCTVEVRAR